MADLYVLAPQLSREEAAELRQLFKAEGTTVRVCTAAGHTAGQRLYGDVVVIGTGAPTIEQDAVGEVKRYVSMATLRAGLDRRKDPEPAAVVSEPASPDPARPPVAPVPDQDPAGMTRQDMMKYAAEHWPGQRRWATLSNEELLAAIKELEATD